jgi:hypothetical protein
MDSREEWRNEEKIDIGLKGRNEERRKEPRNDKESEQEQI